jgi:hypothetical protein
MAYGGSSEFLLLNDPIGIGPSYTSGLSTGVGPGSALWLRYSSDESTDHQNIAGYYTGVSGPPYQTAGPQTGGGSSGVIGLRLGDVVICVESTAGARPGRVTLHSVLRSTANFSTATYKSTGAWDVTLSNSSTL